jgi:hypothetical protein
MWRDSVNLLFNEELSDMFQKKAQTQYILLIQYYAIAYIILVI